MSRSLPGNFAWFTLIGAAGTLLQYAVLVLLVTVFSANPVVAAQGGAALGALANYLLNRRLNYRETRGHTHTGPRFAVVVLVGFLLNGIIVAALTGAGGWHYLLAQAFATVLILGWGFLANHFWTFSKGRT